VLFYLKVSILRKILFLTVCMRRSRLRASYLKFAHHGTNAKMKEEEACDGKEQRIRDSRRRDAGGRKRSKIDIGIIVRTSKYLARPVSGRSDTGRQDLSAP